MFVVILLLHGHSNFWKKNHGICYVNIKMIQKYFLEWHAVIFSLIKNNLFKIEFFILQACNWNILIKSPVTAVAVFALFSPHQLKLGGRDVTPFLYPCSVTETSVLLKLVVRLGGRRQSGYFSLPVLFPAVDQLVHRS